MSDNQFGSDAVRQAAEAILKMVPAGYGMTSTEAVIYAQAAGVSFYRWLDSQVGDPMEELRKALGDPDAG